MSKGCWSIIFIYIYVHVYIYNYISVYIYIYVSLFLSLDVMVIATWDEKTHTLDWYVGIFYLFTHKLSHPGCSEEMVLPPELHIYAENILR